MSYEYMLIHECDIYHLKSREGSGNFGIPDKDVQRETYYKDKPDIKGQICYLSEKSQGLTQAEPNHVIVQTYLAHFPIDANIKINSKVFWEGITLKAQKPRNIRNHHQEVILVRSDDL